MNTCARASSAHTKCEGTSPAPAKYHAGKRFAKKGGRTVADAGAGTQHMHGSTGVAAVVIFPRVQMHEAFTVRPSVWLVQQLLQSAAWNLLTES